MLSNDFHRKLIDNSHNEATITEDRRYGVHFEYKDICKRLISIQREREQHASPFHIKHSPSTTLNKPSIIRDIRKPPQVSKFVFNHARSSVKLQRDLSPIFTDKLNKSRESISTQILKTPASKPSRVKPYFLKEVSLSPFRYLDKSSDSYIQKKTPLSIKNSASKSFMEKSRYSIGLPKRIYLKRRAV